MFSRQIMPLPCSAAEGGYIHNCPVFWVEGNALGTSKGEVLEPFPAIAGVGTEP